MRATFSFLFLLIPLQLFSQQYISGRIRDKASGDPIEFAHVYLANTTIGTTSDVTGDFLLDNIPEGQFDLIITMVGYVSFVRKVNTTERGINDLLIELVPDKKVLENVEVNDNIDRKWRRQFKRFRKELLGNVSNARYCEITNPWVVDFNVGKDKNIFKASAVQPLIIRNNALGYEISFLLQNFGILNDQFFYVGYPRFEELKVENIDSTGFMAKSHLSDR